MPSCFWSLCDCPIEQPCPEHDGTGCSLINGKAIEKEADVADAITHAAEAAIAQLEGDTVRLDEIRKTLEDHKTQLEKERDGLEKQAQQAKTKAQRQALVDEERAIAKRHEHLEAEIKALVAEIDALGASFATAAAKITAALAIPYSDPAGYCTCYKAKLADLTKLAGKITVERTTLAAATTAYNSARAGVVPKLKITFSIAIGIFVWLFVMFGTFKGRVFAAFIALLITAIVVVGLCLQLYSLKRAMLQSRIALLKLLLSYYRTQQIPTCVKDR